MEIELTHTDEFDRYESGRMAQPEADSFRKRLLQDQDLADEHRLYLALCSGIRTFHRKRLKQLLNDTETLHSISAPKIEVPATSENSVWQWAVAASIAILIGAGIVLWQFTGQPSAWEQAFIEEPGLPVLMSKQTPVSGQYNEAMNFYRQGDYKQAAISLPANNSDTVAYYRGIFALKQNQPAQALTALEPLLRNFNSEFKEKADYYAAMAYWKAGQNSRAETVFKTIAANPEHIFHEQALQILKDSDF